MWSKAAKEERERAREYRQLENVRRVNAGKLSEGSSQTRMEPLMNVDRFKETVDVGIASVSRRSVRLGIVTLEEQPLQT